MAKLNATLSFDLDTYAGVDNETLVIDARTREIYIPDPENVFGVQYDKDSKYVKFKVVNEVSEVFKMEDALIRINYRDSKGIIGSSLAVDKVTDYDKCEFSWIVPNNALKNKGDLYFVVSAVVVDEDGIIQKRWSTTLSRVVTPESIYSKSASLDQNERDEIAMLLLLVSEKCNQAIEDIGEARDTGVTTITNIKDSGIEELNDLISKYGIRFEDLNVLKSRIDQLFDSGNLPGSNTEVTDIRIGYDGKTYSTAGNAVRIQISNIMEMILDNNFYTPLLIDRDFELIDEENNTLQADWKYKVDGNQDLNGGSDNVGDSGDIAYELESLRNQIKFELKQIKAETSGLKEGLVFNQKEDAKTKRSLSALWDLNKGISYRFETDSEKAYKKQIPSGAKLATINKVGGKTIAMNQLIDPSRRDAEKIEFDESTKHFKYDNWNAINTIYICKNINVIKGHKYYIFATDKIRYAILYLYGEGVKESLSKDTDKENDVKKIITATGTGLINLYLNRYLVTSENVSYFDGSINLFDLTEIFGSGNEPSAPEEFEAIFPNDYYPYNEGELMSMSVNDVIYTDTSSNQTSHPIPQSIQNIDGYGWSAGTAYNYVDFENKKYYKCVDRVDLGSLLWNDIGISYGSVYRYDASLFKVGKAQENNVICSRFEKNIISTKDTECYNFHNEFRYLIIQSNIDSLDAFKNAMQGVYLYYELAEPIVIDISEFIGDTFQDPFEVEKGGSLTFKNTNGDGYQIAVPSDIQYVVSLSEVNS